MNAKKLCTMALVGISMASSIGSTLTAGSSANTSGNNTNCRPGDKESCKARKDCKGRGACGTAMADSDDMNSCKGKGSCKGMTGMDKKDMSKCNPK